MENKNKMASFICDKRKAKGLTQKQLAEKLNVTDKAVSKWERGLSYPDITLIIPLCDILEVSASELLKGERTVTQAQSDDAIVETTLDYAQKVTKIYKKGVNIMFKGIISAIFILAIFVCGLVDFVLNGSFTWSVFPISSIIFIWLIIMPCFFLNKNRLACSFLSLTVFIIPFLYIIEQNVQERNWLLTIALPITIVSLIYGWGLLYLFVYTRYNKWFVTSISTFFMAILSMVINFIVDKALSNQLNVYDIWDLLTIFLLVIVSIILFLIGKRSKNMNVTKVQNN